MNQRRLISQALLVKIVGIAAIATHFGSGRPAASAPPEPPPATGSKDIDDDDKNVRLELTKRAVRENCLICHSEELIRTQRLTPKQWKAEVEKMIGWGSPLPPEWQLPTIEYLASAYSTTAPPFTADREPLAMLVGPDDISAIPKPLGGDLKRGVALYEKHCANCHGADAQGADLGSNLVERRALLMSGPYADLVRQGRGRMPGFAGTLDAKAETDILEWLRARRYRPASPGKK